MFFLKNRTQNSIPVPLIYVCNQNWNQSNIYIYILELELEVLHLSKEPPIFQDWYVGIWDLLQ